MTLSISGTGSLLVSHVDRLVSDDLTSMLHKLGTNGKLELHIIGAFADSMGISEALLVPILSELFIQSLKNIQHIYTVKNNRLYMYCYSNCPLIFIRYTSQQPRGAGAGDLLCG